MRFLPVRLQPYVHRGYVLFVSSRRSVSGAGGAGQCGSGVEDYLNVVDVQNPGRVKARFLVGSCVENIELADVNRFEDFQSFRVEGGRLGIRFLSYDDRCGEDLTAFSNADFKGLRFVSSC